MLASYPTQGWAPQSLSIDLDDELNTNYNQRLPQQYQFGFQLGLPQKQPAQHAHPVPAPAQPLIPEDNGFRFSHFIQQQQQQQQQQQTTSPSSPSTPPLSSTYSHRSSFSSSGPFSAMTPSSSTTFPSFNPQATSTYTELQGFDTYSSPQPAPVLTHPIIPQRQITPTNAKKRAAPATAPAHEVVKTEKPDTKRPSGACTRCKKMKMKCEFSHSSDPSCQRCKSGKYDCVVEGRKPRTPSQREWLLAQIRQKDAMIATILKAYNPHSSVTPLTLASSKLNVSREERAAHREALTWAEKGPPATAAGASQRYRMRYKDRGKREEDADDDDWSSDSYDESEEAWDEAVEAAFLRSGDEGGEARLYAHALPEGDAPLGLIARLSLEEEEEVEAVAGTKRGADKMLEQAEGEDDRWGVANPDFFQPGPSANLSIRRVLNERETPPAIIASGLISWQEAEKLFEIFYEFINPFVSVLDPVLHTVSSVYERCPFLFTVVCAISLRYFPARPGIHKIGMHFAKTAAATAFVDGYKSVELVQGYLLLSSYGPPARRWEEDRSWFYGGLASRIATDLALHRAVDVKPLSERHERELLNRVRVWLNCFNVDRSSSTQWGKPSGLKEDEAVRGAKEWYRKSKYNHPYDVHMVGYTELLRVFSRFHQQVYSDPHAPSGLNKRCNFRAIIESMEVDMRACLDDVEWRYANDSDPDDPGSVIRTKGVPIFENYMRLVMYSFGFEDAWRRRGVEPGDMFFAKCLNSASVVVRHLTEVYAPSGYLKYAPDCFFVMGGFCSAFLLKLLRPEFDSLLDETQRIRIVDLVTRFVDVLASPAASIDDSHTPKLYAKFLHGQLRHVSKAGLEAKKQAQGPISVPVSGQPESHSETRQPDSQSTTPEPEPPVFSHSTPGGHSSSSGSSVPTPGPESQSWLDDSWTDGSGSVTATAAGRGVDDSMELCQEDYLATMQAVSSEQWWNTMLMPGHKWPTDEPMLGIDGDVAGADPLGLPMFPMA